MKVFIDCTPSEQLSDKSDNEVLTLSAVFMNGWVLPSTIEDYKEAEDKLGSAEILTQSIESSSSQPIVIGWVGRVTDWSSVGKEYLEEWNKAKINSKDQWSINIAKLPVTVAEAMFGYLGGILLSISAARNLHKIDDSVLEVEIDSLPGNPGSGARFVLEMIKSTSFSELWQELNANAEIKLDWGNHKSLPYSSAADWMAQSISANEYPEEWLARNPTRGEEYRSIIAQPFKTLKKFGNATVWHEIVKWTKSHETNPSLAERSNVVPSDQKKFK